MSHQKITTAEPLDLQAEIEQLARAAYHRSRKATERPPLTEAELVSEAWIAYSKAEVNFQTIHGGEGDFTRYLRRSVKRSLGDALIKADFNVSSRTAKRMVAGELSETSAATIKSMSQARSLSYQPDAEDIFVDDLTTAPEDEDVPEDAVVQFDDDSFMGGDPLAYILQKEEVSMLYKALDTLEATHAPHAALLRSLYGIGCPASTPKELAEAEGVRLQSLCDRRDRALSQLRKIILSENLHGQG